MIYKLAPFVTVKMLLKERFKEVWCDSKDGHMLDRNINPEDEDDSIYIMFWVPFWEYLNGVETRVLKYNKGNRTDDMTPYIQDLIDKKMVIANE